MLINKGFNQPTYNSDEERDDKFFETCFSGCFELVEKVFLLHLLFPGRPPGWRKLQTLALLCVC